MKVLGIVSPKAGRTLLYRVSDVAKMYPHWKMMIPDFIDELCAGKVCVCACMHAYTFRRPIIFYLCVCLCGVYMYMYVCVCVHVHGRA